MATIIPEVSKSVTAATASGVLTVDSTTTIWPNQSGWLSKAGQTSVRIRVTEILSATTFKAAILPTISDGNFAQIRPNATGADTPASYPTNTFSNLSAFNAGATFNAEAQVVNNLGFVADSGKIARD